MVVFPLEFTFTIPNSNTGSPGFLSALTFNLTASPKSGPNTSVIETTAFVRAIEPQISGYVDAVRASTGDCELKCCETICLALQVVWCPICYSSATDIDREKKESYPFFMVFDKRPVTEKKGDWCTSDNDMAVILEAEIPFLESWPSKYYHFGQNPAMVFQPRGLGPLISKASSVPRTSDRPPGPHARRIMSSPAVSHLLASVLQHGGPSASRQKKRRPNAIVWCRAYGPYGADPLHVAFPGPQPKVSNLDAELRSGPTLADPASSAYLPLSSI
ncbi:hypothetical protein V8F20_012211 [Naviculisporaceae sp. PSN 640]